MEQINKKGNVILQYSYEDYQHEILKIIASFGLNRNDLVFDDFKRAETVLVRNYIQRQMYANPNDYQFRCFINHDVTPLAISHQIFIEIKKNITLLN